MIMTRPAKLSTTVPHEGRMYRAPREPIEFLGLHADRENTDADRSVRGLECVRIAAWYSAFLPQIAREICGIDFGLKTEQVVMDHCRNEVFMIRERGENFHRWKRDVVEKADLVAVTALT
jgi:hypothetical protein